jgi:hypothetical protein
LRILSTEAESFQEITQELIMTQETIYPVRPPEKPGMVTAIGVLTLISGISNILAGLGITFSVVVFTLGIGLICFPFTILPAVLGIFEVMYAIKLLANPAETNEISQTIAILEIVTLLGGNGLSPIVGVLALIFANDQRVRDYFAALRSATVVKIQSV